MSKVELKVLTHGIALEEILQNQEGICYFPEHGELTVKALEYITAYQEVIVATGKRQVKAAYPWVQSPVYNQDDYALLATGPTQLRYVIGTNAFAADPNVSLFEAKSVTVFCTQAFLLRFNSQTRVQHTIPANTYFTYNRRCAEIYYQQVALPGVLQVWAEG